MYEANSHKFAQNKDLAEVLIKSTGKITSHEGFWGEWNPLILTRIRAELRHNSEEDEQVAAAITKQMK